MLATSQGVPGSGQSHASIPFAELGAKAGAHYQGDGLSVLPAPEGARLRCIFQKLEAQATPEGLWLASTVKGSNDDHFRIVATSVWRGGQTSMGGAEPTRLTPTFDFEFGVSAFDSECGNSAGNKNLLPGTGTVAVEGKLVVSFTRPGLIEEYSVSVDGVRQDFVVLQRPGGAGKLRVELDVAGAKTEALADEARLVLDSSGRQIAYSRLRAADAQGRELAAHIEIASPNRLALVVDDAAASYPVRIDPTFSDANWVSMGGGNQGANGVVLAAVVDGLGNLYIGGAFTAMGVVAATNVAQWNGSTWSALGSGLNTITFLGGSAVVNELAVSGTDLYAGGSFNAAGGIWATNIAKWNGCSWTPLGAGLDNTVNALAVSGTNLYAGGDFGRAGGAGANHVARWDGSVWWSL